MCSAFSLQVAPSDTQHLFALVHHDSANLEVKAMPLPKEIDSISSYLRAWAPELGERILQTYPPLHGFEDAASEHVGALRRNPFPAQTLAIMGVVKRWNEARGAAVIAECGTGKTLISLGAVHVHSERKSCGVDFKQSDVRRHVDHIVPARLIRRLRAGNPNRRENLECICRTCHGYKLQADHKLCLGDKLGYIEILRSRNFDLARVERALSLYGL
jgi:HNH endonuclease